MYDYGYGYDANYVAGTATGMLGLMGGIYIAMMIFSFIIGLIAIISYAKIFIKAGKPWWASIVPVYNMIVMLEIAKLPIWYIALFFVPIANIYAIFKINIEIAKKFGKTTGFGVGMTLLSIIFIPLLAFSDNKYEDNSNALENVNNQFDGNIVINNNTYTNDVNVAVAPIGNMETAPAPVAPVEEVVAPVENVMVEPVSIESAPMAPVEEVVAPVENVMVEPAPIETAPVAPVEEVVAPVENVMVEPAPIETAPVAPIEEVVAPVENVATESTINAFNIEPQVAMSEQNIINNSVVDVNANIVEAKKVCKNCNNELPDIVSICPNCGTDNE